MVISSSITVAFGLIALFGGGAGLDSIDMAEASLLDMGGHFVLRLSAISGKPEILWEVKKAAVSGAVATAAFRSQIDEDTLAHVRRQFTQFESWWD